MKSPAESLRAIVPRPGFRVELVAAEPLLRSPVAIDFDEDGRLYVAEFPEYNQYKDVAKRDAGARHETGCIRMLEDADGDGTYEKSTLFAPDVPIATAVACWDGGVFAGSAPDLLYLKDTDGDGKADRHRTKIRAGSLSQKNKQPIRNHSIICLVSRRDRARPQRFSIEFDGKARRSRVTLSWSVGSRLTTGTQAGGRTSAAPIGRDPSR